MQLTKRGAGVAQAMVGVMLLGAGVVGASAAAQASAPQYRLVKSLVIGGSGSWDYLSFDRNGRRLYISHDTHVVVFDPDQGKVVGEIGDVTGVHGIAVVEGVGRGFISSGKDNTIVIFDLKTLQVISKVQSTGKNPDCIIFDPASGRVFTFNGLSGTATAIEASTGKIAGTIELGGAKPEYAASDGRGNVWVNLEDKDETIELDPVHLRTKARFPLGSCHQPASLALDSENRRLFVGCRNQLLAVLNADTGATVATLPIGAGVDANIFDGPEGLVFTANRDGTISVIRETSPNSFAVVDTIKTQAGAGSLALDTKTGNLYTVTADLGPVPPVTAENPRPRAPVIDGTFRILTISKQRNGGF
jgi:DNA-binding beta-propeller fold protein YncE